MCYSLSALIKIGRYHGVPCQVTLATLLPCTPLHIKKFTTSRVAKISLFSKCMRGVQNYNFIFGPNFGRNLKKKKKSK